MKNLLLRMVGCVVGGVLVAMGCSESPGVGVTPGDGEASGAADAEASLSDQSEAADAPDGPASDATVDEVDEVDAAGEPEVSTGCPPEMARIGSFCVDRYEAFVVEIHEDGVETSHSPFVPVDGLDVRAKSAPGVTPQAYISQVQADGACARAGKRLCRGDEFALACRGDDPQAHYPYAGAARMPGACNEGKGSPVVRLFGSDPTAWTYADFNDARLDQLSDTLAPTGTFPRCASPYGVYDCVGNLNEWGADPPDVRGHGKWRGGSFVDSEINGPGCLYVTTAHEPTYHDFSTGFRCCRDAF